jgi:predicted ABC-type ATPase
MPRKFNEAGYDIHLIFFGLEDPELSQLRVTDRVLEGGHYVDRVTLENNFYGNLEKLNIHYQFINHLTIVDTSEIDHRILFKISNHHLEFYLDKEKLPEWFIEYLPSLFNLIQG